VEPTRERAWETLTKHTQSEALLRHALAVEASTAWYARHFGEDEELWRVVALLHEPAPEALGWYVGSNRA